MATLASRPKSRWAIGRLSRRTFAGAASLLSVATLALGCDGEGTSNRVRLTDTLGCSTSYVAKSTDALGVEETGNCKFHGSEIALVTFADNAARNNYVCSTCGYSPDTEDGAIESAARRLGSRLVAGDRYLVRVPDAASEQGVREVLG